MRIFGRRKSREQELERELRAHLDLESEEQRAAGLGEDDARYAAQRAFGNQTLTKENVRAAWRFAFLETLAQDLRYAFRSLRASPVFALVAIASLGLGIGANSAIFSFVNALLLKKLPVPVPDRLVTLAEYEKGKQINSVFSYPMIKQLGQRNQAFDGIFGRYPVRMNLTLGDSSEPLRGEVVTGAYYKTLQVKPALGRLLDDNDVEAAVANPVCVISYELWQTRLGADPHILGRNLLLDAHPYTVIGVTEKGFFGPQLEYSVDLQVPISRAGDFMKGPFASKWDSSGSWLQPLARLKPGLTVGQAQAMIEPLARGLRLELVDPKRRGNVRTTSFRLSGASQGVNGNGVYFKPVTVLMGVVSLVLLTACANVANLLLARAGARTAEFAVRLSLGASRSRLIRQLMVESLLLACGGGVLAAALAFWMIRTLLLYLNSGQIGGDGIHAAFDVPEIGFTISLSLLTAVLFGLLPAWQAAKQDIVPDLKKVHVQTSAAWLRKFLIVVEIALSMVILFAAGLLTRTLSQLRTVDLGFEPAQVMAVDFDPPASGYNSDQTDQAFDAVLSRLRSQAWVRAASLAVYMPLGGGMMSMDFDLPGRTAKSTDVQTNFNIVTPQYFKTVNQSLLAGRDFNDTDLMNAPQVAIVNQRFVQQYTPGESPLGRRINLSGQSVEIVGLVNDSSYQFLREAKCPLVYLPVKQAHASRFALLVRTALSSPQAKTAVARTIHAADPKLTVFSVRELREIIDRGITSERVMSFLASLFSALVTLLCSMGIYGVIAYAVSRRTREIGVRFAIGAQKSDVAKLFLRESAVLIGAGVLFGVPLALAAARVLKSLLFGVESTDVVMLSVSAAILVAAAVLSSLLPVRKATDVEPTQALRYE